MKRGWNVVTLKQYIDTLLLERKQHVADLMTERDKAIAEFKESTQKNFADRNEIQTAMKEAAETSERATALLVATLMPRSEVMALLQRNAADIKDVTDRVNQNQGHGAGIKDSWGWVVAVAGLLVAIGTMAIALYVSLKK